MYVCGIRGDHWCMHTIRYSIMFNHVNWTINELQSLNTHAAESLAFRLFSLLLLRFLVRKLSRSGRCGSCSSSLVLRHFGTTNWAAAVMVVVESRTPTLPAGCRLQLCADPAADCCHALCCPYWPHGWHCCCYCCCWQFRSRCRYWLLGRCWSIVDFVSATIATNCAIAGKHKFNNPQKCQNRCDICPP